ncbi:MAG: S8 family serine peptidase [Ignavibacteriales bacterium]|nr:S8 family serine peptidase [Ignavibacteriales bacterium]
MKTPALCGIRIYAQMTTTGLAAAVALLLLAASAPAQQLVVKQFGAKDSLVSYSSKSIVAGSFSANRLVSSSSADLSERIKIIVKFSTPSRLERRKQLTLTEPSLQNQSLLRTVTAAAPGAVVTRSFSESFSGIAVEVPREELESIRSAPGVLSIALDVPVKASGGAPSDIFTPALPDNVSVTGRGVRVGIIDTGIDYNHEALGGGKGVVVSGGYDFVNNDADPMDDNGHGTHVAGIIAGNSSMLHSRAPGAKLYAYKVLDNAGNGLMSTVLAGLEQAIKDSMNVINMSLGSSAGDPFDPLSEAVNRAVESGIVVVVAAGNSGENGSIGSPAAAELALTIGAVDAGNAIASFSSKGPTNRIYGIKPDVMAPGVAILSAKMGGGYVQMTGTSMAAPYAAGYAAALRELHPDWSAGDIRSAIVGSAQDLGQSVFSQGSGRIDTARLFLHTTLISPVSISFGFDISREQTWKTLDTLHLVNRAAQSRIYSLHAVSPAPGVAISCRPSSVSIPALGSAPVIVELSVDNALTPNNSTLSGGYRGTIIARSESDTMNIPFAFFKGNLLQLNFSETPFQVLIHNQKGKSYSYSPQSPFLTVAVPEDTYDVITTFYGSRFVFRENIALRGATSVSIDNEEAVNNVTIEPCDESGKLLATATGTTHSFLEAITHKSTGVSQLVMGGGTIARANLKQERFFSPMSNHYAYGFGINVQYGNSKSYTFDAAIDSGISTARRIQFIAADLKHSLSDLSYDLVGVCGRNKCDWYCLL